METLEIIGTAVIHIVIFGYAVVVLWRIIAGSIPLDGLIAEPPAAGDAAGKASLSRFQFLIFTFVVAGLFLLLSIQHGSLVEIPGTVLGLIGISGGSYVVSKAISTASSAPASSTTDAGK